NMFLTSFALLGIAVASGHLEGEMFYDFQNGKEIPPFFNFSEKWMRSEIDGLHVDLRADRPYLGPIALSTKFEIRGDFEITATYRINSWEKPKSGLGPGVKLRIEKSRPRPGSATVGCMLRGNDKSVGFWEWAKDEKGKPTTTAGQAPNASSVGKLRLKRTG